MSDRYVKVICPVHGRLDGFMDGNHGSVLMPHGRRVWWCAYCLAEWYERTMPKIVLEPLEDGDAVADS